MFFSFIIIPKFKVLELKKFLIKFLIVVMSLEYFDHFFGDKEKSLKFPGLEVDASPPKYILFYLLNFIIR